MRFEELAIGQSFDFVSGSSLDSFFSRCQKISARKYSFIAREGVCTARIGTILAPVFNAKCTNCGSRTYSPLALDRTNRQTCALCARV